MKRRGLAVASRIASYVFILAWVALAIFDKNFPPPVVPQLIIFSTAIVSWFFVISYHFKSIADGYHWWGNEMGRHVMAFVAVEAGIFSLLSWVTITPRLALDTWFMWLYFGTVSGMAWVTLWRILILFRADDNTESKVEDERKQEVQF